MINTKSPKVKNVIGNVNINNIGLTKTFNTDKITANQNAPKKLLAVIPGKNFDSINTIIAVEIHFNKLFI